jgi:hypothetical protein
MSKFNPPIEEVVKKGADVISFGARKMEKAGRVARERMTMQGFQSGIPGAEGWSQMVEPEKLIELTQPREFNTLAVIDNDIMDRISRIADDYLPEDSLQYVDELVEGVASGRNTGDFISIAEDTFPTVRGQLNLETGDIELFVDPEQIVEARAYKALRLRDPQRFSDNGMPFDIDWSESAPWLDVEDWTHSGRVRFLNEDGEELARLRVDEINFPFDSDIMARRDPEAAAKWWSDNPLPVWMPSSEATTKYQAQSPREVNEFLRVMYSPDAARFWDTLRHTSELGALGKGINKFMEETGIQLTRAQQEARVNDPVLFITEFLSGQIDSRVTLDGVLDFADDIPKLRRILSGESRKAQRVADAEARSFAADEQILAPLDEITNHFNVVMTRMREQDPRRYQAMLDFVGDSPYRQGNIWPGSLGGDHPMLIFHSSRSLNMEKMGYPDIEMPQFLTPRESGMHTGDLHASSDIAGYSVVTSSRNPTGLAGKPRETSVSQRQKNMQDKLQNKMKPEMYAAYQEIARRVHEETLDVMLDQYGTGRLKFPDPGTQILERLDPDLAKLVDIRPDELEPELLRDLITQYLGSRTDSMADTDLQTVAFAIREHANTAWHSAHTATFPLVFRGKRPFRLADVSGNTPDRWAQEALNYPGFQQNSDWKERLEAISRGFYGGSTEEQLKAYQAGTKDFHKVLEEAGFDHIIYVNRVENAGHPSIVFWDQSLAKPLYGSRGFDPNSKSWANSVLASPLFGLGEEEETGGDQ